METRQFQWAMPPPSAGFGSRKNSGAPPSTENGLRGVHPQSPGERRERQRDAGRHTELRGVIPRSPLLHNSGQCDTVESIVEGLRRDV
eukprot:4075070-Prymnesium_polylepis.1